MYTTLFITVDDGYREVSFKVPTDWLTERVEKDYGMGLSRFLEEYTSDESGELRDAAILDGVLVGSF